MREPISRLPEHLETLAAFAVEGVRTQLDPAAEQFARTLLLDTLGALVGGATYPQVEAMLEQLGPGDIASPNGSFAALFRLGCASTWLDADSGGSFHPQGHRLPPVPTAHPAPHVLPVLLRGAARGLPDDHLVRVFALSVEVGMRFGTATTLRPGMHPHGIHGTVAAAVAEALLRGHDIATTAAAMAQALTLPVAARLWQPMQGGTVRNAWTGLGAYYGARAAVEVGVRRAVQADDAVRTLATVATREGDPDALVDGLGRRWVFLDSYLKPYACARWVHPVLEAVTEAVAARRQRGAVAAATEVETVRVETFAYAASLSAVDARSDMHARFSVPVCTATLLLDGELHAPAFLPGRLGREAVGDLARRVDLREDPALTAALPHERPARVTITWRDGTTTRGSVRNARGNPDHPLSRAEVTAKFLTNSTDLLGTELAEHCVTSLLDGGSSAVLDQVTSALTRAG